MKHKKNKIVVIGIDGMDSMLLSQFIDELPNLKKLRENGYEIKSKSVFPPDSPTAWMSIYTGLNPAKHGGVFFKDPLNPKEAGEHTSINIADKTFWDIISKSGGKVCVLFPHMGYPPWNVNGVIVGRTTETDLKEFDIKVTPEKELYKRYDLSQLKPLSSYPLNLNDLVNETKKLISKEVEFGLKIFNDFDWDIFFIYFSSLDNIEHIFWMYCDEDDPEHPPDNPYKNVIRDMYKFYDKEVIGKFMDKIEKLKSGEGSGISMIVLSDHGHAMRPVNIININEFLRQKGMLYSKIKNKVGKHYLIEKIKKQMANIISENRVVGKLASLFLKLFPGALKSYTSSSPIDFNKTIAYVSDPSGGIKAYSYGGIKIVKDNISNNNDYEEIKDLLINHLSELKEIEWCNKREEIYGGQYINKYPDILFKLREGYGVGWNVNEGIYGRSYSHKLHSGNHRQDTSVFILSPANDFNIRTKYMNITDIAPTILDILDIKGKFNFDGKSIIDK